MIINLHVLSKHQVSYHYQTANSHMYLTIITRSGGLVVNELTIGLYWIWSSLVVFYPLVILKEWFLISYLLFSYCISLMTDADIKYFVLFLFLNTCPNTVYLHIKVCTIILQLEFWFVHSLKGAISKIFKISERRLCNL